MDLITVLGPTATGKTQFAVQLTGLIGGEIISADSRQVYRGMDIGTGKDLNDYIVNGKQISYHLIDIVDAGEKYNVFRYQSDFLKVYDNLKSKNILPVLCGGSGMYIEAVLKGYKLINVPVNESLREMLNKYSLQELEQKLKQYGQLHNKTDVDTKKRAIRAIEIAEYYKTHPDIDFSFPEIKSLIFGIKFDRKIVKERITYRLKERLQQGMIDEVEELIKQGVDTDTLEYYGLEYKFIVKFLKKELSYNHMVEKLNVAIHQFSKRQMTWFRKMERQGFKIYWIDGELPEDKKISTAMEIINNHNYF
jgi:tRNA dimethylallyltransferase